MMGKIRWQSSSRATGTTTLHEGSGKRFPRAVADDVSFTMDETPVGWRPAIEARKEPVIKTLMIAAVAGVVAAASPALAAEMTVGLTAGPVVSGDQDVSINGQVQRRSPDVGPLVGLTATAWGRAEWRWLGLQLDALHWRTPVTARPTAATTKLDVDQTRTALLLSVLGRVPFERSGMFAYGGIGGGAAYTTVERGAEGLGGALGLVGGVAIPLGRQFRLRGELRYLVTGDSDAERAQVTRVDISGNRHSKPAHAIFGPHQDTQFVPILIGVDWVF